MLRVCVGKPSPLYLHQKVSYITALHVPVCTLIDAPTPCKVEWLNTSRLSTQTVIPDYGDELKGFPGGVLACVPLVPLLCMSEHSQQDHPQQVATVLNTDLYISAQMYRPVTLPGQAFVVYILVGALGSM